MNRLLQTLLIGALAVLAFDLIGSILSRAIGFDYTLLAFGSLVIYAAVGIFASRDFFLLGPIAAGIVGLVDSTLGWYLSWVIGPGKVEDLSPEIALLTVLFVTAEATVTGLLAAGVALLVRPR